MFVFAGLVLFLRYTLRLQLKPRTSDPPTQPPDFWITMSSLYLAFTSYVNWLGYRCATFLAKPTLIPIDDGWQTDPAVCFIAVLYREAPLNIMPEYRLLVVEHMMASVSSETRLRLEEQAFPVLGAVAREQ